MNGPRGAAVDGDRDGGGAASRRGNDTSRRGGGRPPRARFTAAAATAFTPPPTTAAAATAAAGGGGRHVETEEQRRQQAVRVFVMCLFLLVLVDDENSNRNRNRNSNRYSNLKSLLRIRASSKHRLRATAAGVPTDDVIYWNDHNHHKWTDAEREILQLHSGRRVQDMNLQESVRKLGRYTELIHANGGMDVARSLWLSEDLPQDSDFASAHTAFLEAIKAAATATEAARIPPKKSMMKMLRGDGDNVSRPRPRKLRYHSKHGHGDDLVWHYPWNATGYYRGMWSPTLQTLERPLPCAIPYKHMNGTTTLEYERPVTSKHNMHQDQHSNHNNEALASQQQRHQQRLALQLQSRLIPGMAHMSLVDGLIQLDTAMSAPNETIAHSTTTSSNLWWFQNTAMILRVRGVLLHETGQLSLISNAPSALMMARDTRSNTTTTNVRPDDDDNNNRNGGMLWDSSADLAQDDDYDATIPKDQKDEFDILTDTVQLAPFPYVMDDANRTLSLTKTVSARKLPIRETNLESLTAHCVFELHLDVSPSEWSAASWRRLVHHQASLESYIYGALETAPILHMAGTVHSENCNFTAHLNATAIRTDWDATTGKAIQYSFCMMLVCLTQILILLRQLLHNQQTIRVSLLSIGWQTCLDALWCLLHIYLSLAIPPLFTAFCSVAFFKLLIFCVIEMKYMAIVTQARRSAANTSVTGDIRRQMAWLHARFYACLLVVATLLVVAKLPTNTHNRVYLMLALYSFWVPQIVWNVVTEARQPLHTYFLNGMSATRLVAPLYLFGVRDNFLTEVYADTSPYDPVVCQAIVAWVACQTMVLTAQSKYGARFMIPARFLPPKFDYSRPLPASLLPAGTMQPPPPTMDNESEQSSLTRRHASATTFNAESTTRNRRHATPAPCSSGVVVTLECSICYDNINVADRPNYMLAPCNHLFHRACLEQWMLVKLECPVCRTELPTT